MNSHIFKKETYFLRIVKIGFDFIA